MFFYDVEPIFIVTLRARRALFRIAIVFHLLVSDDERKNRFQVLFAKKRLEAP
jgi:hypothetical protein